MHGICFDRQVLYLYFVFDLVNVLAINVLFRGLGHISISGILWSYFCVDIGEQLLFPVDPYALFT